MKYNIPIFSNVKVNGYVQDGYVPILSYTEWKSATTMCLTEPMHEIVSSTTIPVDSAHCGVVTVDALTGFVDGVREWGLDTVHLTVNSDRDENISSVEMSATRMIHVPRSESSYRESYRKYFMEIYELNKVHELEFMSQITERELYKTLFKKYGPLLDD